MRDAKRQLTCHSNQSVTKQSIFDTGVLRHPSAMKQIDDAGSSGQVIAQCQALLPYLEDHRALEDTGCRIAGLIQGGFVAA
jgi:hypothetical protein